MSQDKHYYLECGCPEEVCEEITVSVPVSVHAHAEIGEVKLTCEKRECINGDDKPCHSNGDSKFKIVRKMKLCVPVKFVTECDIGEACCDYDLGDCGCSGTGGGSMVVEQ